MKITTAGRLDGLTFMAEPGNSYVGDRWKHEPRQNLYREQSSPNT